MWRNTHFTTRPGVLCGTCRMTTYPECPPSTLLALPTVFLWHTIWGELVLWMSPRKKAQRGMVHSLGLSQSTHLLGTIKAHEESEVLGLVGGPVGNLVPPMLCPAPPTTAYECVSVELFYPKELSARTEFSSFAPSMWWWSLVPCGCWAYELWLVCPRWWISLMCLCGIDGHEWRYLWKPEEGMRSFGAGVKSVEKSQMWVLCESSMC